MAVLPARVLFGAAYYHEYQPCDRLDTDLDLMVEAGFTVIRVGESVWSTWEPENGRFDLDWLRPVLDGAHERGISVVLGTPTYAVPPWLARQYPEIAGVQADGRRVGWGARQEVDFTHPAFRFHAERIIRKIAGRYADHPAVIGFQVDNEPGIRLLHNHGVFQRFVDHLRTTYGDVENLNRAWGLVYWSHRLSTWADLWTPEGNAQPQYDVAWRAFQAGQTTEFVAWQAGIVREYARPEQFVTTCLHYPHVALDDDELTDHVDVTAGNPYYDMQDALTLPDPDNLDQDWKTRGVWAFYRGADWIFSSRQEPFLVTETNAGNIGTPWDNRPAYDGQWRQAAWAFVARGARMIEYWHWHTVHFGAETFWGGVLPHSGQPGRVYAELAQLGSEFAAAGAAVAGIVPDADVAMVYSLPNKWYMQKYPPLSTPDGQPDAGAYQRIFDAFYRGAFEAGLQVRMIHARKPAELDQHRVLVVPALHLADDATLDRLAAYAHAGGHLVIGPRTGYADQEARARRERAPGRLVEAAGVHYDEFSNLSQDLRVHAPEDSALALPEDASATLWVEGLTPVDADVLAEYDHHHFGRWPAITTRRHGAGRVTYVGTVPGRSLATALAAWLAPAPVSGWRNLPATVTATTGTSPDGSRVHVVHNWSGDRVQANAPVALTDLLDGAEVVAGGRIALGERDVRVFVERA